jgi:hypothetical protein
LESRRNSFAHDEIENCAEILSTWEIIVKGNISSNPDFGVEIANICDDVESCLNSSDDDYN